MRQGHEKEIHVNDIKVGDLVKIRTGMAIPCDGVVVTGTGITTNESAMTGESIELKKDPLHMCFIKQEEKEEEQRRRGGTPEHHSHDLPSPVMLSGTEVQTGEGFFMVIVVGKNSCVGKIYSKLE